MDFRFVDGVGQCALFSDPMDQSLLDIAEEYGWKRKSTSASITDRHYPKGLPEASGIQLTYDHVITERNGIVEAIDGMKRITSEEREHLMQVLAQFESDAKTLNKIIAKLFSGRERKKLRAVLQKGCESGLPQPNPAVLAIFPLLAKHCPDIIAQRPYTTIFVVIMGIGSPKESAAVINAMINMTKAETLTLFA